MNFTGNYRDAYTNDSSTYFISGDKTQVEAPNYDPSEELKLMYSKLEEKLNKNNIKCSSDLLKPTIVAGNNYLSNFDRVKDEIKNSIEVLKKNDEGELKEVTQQKEDWEKRVENDEKHLDTLIKAKKETKLSSPEGLSKDEIPGLFKRLEQGLQELSKIAKDEKQIQKVYTKFLSYIRNKSVEDHGDTNEECAFCIEVENAHKYIQSQFKKMPGEDKWVSVLDDQVRICKLHSQDKHKQLEPENSFSGKDECVIYIAKELHVLCFAFGHLLQFDIKDKAYTKVEFEGNVIFKATPSFYKPNEA